MRTTEPTAEAEIKAIRGWCKGNERATAFILLLGEISQLADDIADGDIEPEGGIERLLLLTLVDLPRNRFYAENMNAFTPLFTGVILQWGASNRMGVSDYLDTRMFAYVLREALEVVISVTAYIVGGAAHAALVTSQVHDFYHVMHGESFETWSSAHEPRRRRRRRSGAAVDPNSHPASGPVERPPAAS